MKPAPFVQLDTHAVRRADERGYLDVLFEDGGVVLKRSFSKAGVFRGMHWQRPPHDQSKLIRTASGRIIDFVFDPSEALPRLYRREINPSDGWILIRPHLAHGFYALEDTEFEYMCLGPYNEAAESSYSILKYLQSTLGLTNLRLSAKDAAAAHIDVVEGDQ